METTIINDTNRFGWQSKESFTSEDVIKAYEKGREKGKETVIKELEKELVDQINKAQMLGHDFFVLLNEEGHNCQKAFLQIAGYNSFKALYIIDEEDYKKEEFKLMYSRSYDFRKNHRINGFEFRITMMPSSKYIEEESIISDGYIFEHE